MDEAAEPVAPKTERREAALRHTSGLLWALAAHGFTALLFETFGGALLCFAAFIAGIVFWFWFNYWLWGGPLAETLRRQQRERPFNEYVGENGPMQGGAKAETFERWW